MCFWYIPQELRNREEDSKYFQELNEVAPKIKARMMEKGSMLVGYQPLGDLPNFFRMVIININTEYEDMDFVLEEISTLGEKI